MAKNSVSRMGVNLFFIPYVKESLSLEKSFICNRDCLLLWGGSG